MKADDNSLLRIDIKRDSNQKETFIIQEKFIEAIPLPLKGKSILNSVSPFYRCKNTQLTLQKDNEIKFPGQI